MNYYESQPLVVVSNRLPVVLKWRDGSWDIYPGSGGLVTALTPILSRNGGTWIGWPGTVEKEGIYESIQEFSDTQGYTLWPVLLDEDDVQGYYYGFSNEILWPLLHGFHNRCNFEADYWLKYQKVNTQFAKEILRKTDSEDYVWVHDYHLMCVAREIEKMGQIRKCGFFLHIPFPGPEIFLKLPWRLEILRALLDFDLVGFQTHQDMNNFIRCLECLCSDLYVEDMDDLFKVFCGSFQVKVGCFPISIDFHQFAQRAASKEVSRRSNDLNLLHQDQQIILGIDRLDYTKGIPQRLEAFRNTLLRFPDLRGKIALLQVVVPSREEVKEYQILKEEIERLVGEINGLYTEPGWIPIHYLYRSLSSEELLSFYIASDMALITPLWDGMNLVVKEYCACNYKEDGVLILSEFAGAASQLFQDSILVNPYDINKVSEAIRRGFYMNKAERKARMAGLREVIKNYDIHFWVKSFLQAVFEDRAFGVPKGHFSDYLTKIDRIG
ncbi:MAG TPA: trehalose-6-phosphate synthase [Desulfohalobiaceae bacterium]|nr:trehalose-6-phosphate synthase [Desulfohalobiaceae bacterium]